MPVIRPSSTSAILASAATAQNSHLSGVIAECGAYRTRLAQTEADKLAVYRLRFMVFNLELHEGLEEAYSDGYDTDHFDSVCDHLLVENAASGEVVGTYRMQSGPSAARNFGYYSEQEFDFAPYEHLRKEVIELGRACIHRCHRSPEVLNLLWKGLMRYSLANGGRYMIGCCSLTSQDAAEGLGVYDKLKRCLVAPELRTMPRPEFSLPVCTSGVPQVQAPRLLRAYLALGANICGEPAIDRAFRTIDFLTMLDLHELNPRIAQRYI